MGEGGRTGRWTLRRPTGGACPLSPPLLRDCEVWVATSRPAAARLGRCAQCAPPPLREWAARPPPRSSGGVAPHRPARTCSPQARRVAPAALWSWRPAIVRRVSAGGWRARRHCTGAAEEAPACGGGFDGGRGKERRLPILPPTRFTPPRCAPPPPRAPLGPPRGGGHPQPPYRVGSPPLPTAAAPVDGASALFVGLSSYPTPCHSYVCPSRPPTGTARVRNDARRQHRSPPPHRPSLPSLPSPPSRPPAHPSWTLTR